MFFVAAPVKPAAPADPVFDGATGEIGDPVAAVPKPELAPEPEAAIEPFPALKAPKVPVASGAVPVANPVDPAITVELEQCQCHTCCGMWIKFRKSHLTAAVLVHEHTVSKYVEVYTIG